MNLYIVVEGKSEEHIYQRWLTHAFPSLSRVPRIEDVQQDHYILFGSMGHPEILRTVNAAVTDISRQPGTFDALVVAVDAEDSGPVQRRRDIEYALTGCPVRTVLAIQDCCIETWLLGNRPWIRSHDGPSRSIADHTRLAAFRAHYDVRTQDPEAMPAADDFVLTRAKYHERYLRAAFAARGCSYRKGFAGEAGELHYLTELVRRHHDTGHIASFGRFLVELRQLGDCRV